jgi:RNA polymerase sigma-70 factor (ECF subfamily)
MDLVVEVLDRGTGTCGPGDARPAQAAPPAGDAAVGEAKLAASPAAVIPAGDVPRATDDALVRASVAGQREAFAELVRRYTRMVYWYVSGRVKDPLEMEEVTQEAMVRSFVDLPRLRTPRAFPNWLLSIAGCVISERRRSGARMVTTDDPASIADARTESLTPPELLSSEELRERLRQEMAQLPAHYRVALALRYMSGCSIEEIAARLMVPEGTVRSRLSRAYAILQKRLESHVGRKRAASGSTVTSASEGGTV